MLAKKWLASTARAVLPLSPSCTIANQTGSRGSLWLGSWCWQEVTCFACKSCASIRSGCGHHVGKKWMAFTARAVLPLGPSCTISNQVGVRASLWLGSSYWYEVTCFHFKSCASMRSKLHYCQPAWFQRFFVAWIIMLVRIDLLSPQALCVH